ncbi:MAG: GNAT family N-acetyltransferase [Vicinamibacterales bacterium]
MVTAQRTYLEMRDPSQLRPLRVSDETIRLERAEDCYPALYRFLYGEVGRRYHWTDRLSWTDDVVRAHLAQPEVSIWLMLVRGTPAGYFELETDDEGGVEIAYFGLFHEFIGRGLGAHLLTEAVGTAWTFAPNRVWLHTCTFDHPAAVPNYISRGFTPFKTEEYSV